MNEYDNNNYNNGYTAQETADRYGAGYGGEDSPPPPQSPEQG